MIWHFNAANLVWIPSRFDSFSKTFSVNDIFCFLFPELLMARTWYRCVVDYEQRSTSCTHIPASQRSSSINDRLFAKNIVLFDVKFVFNLTDNYFHNLIPFLCVIDYPRKRRRFKSGYKIVYQNGFGRVRSPNFLKYNTKESDISLKTKK